MVLDELVGVKVDPEVAKAVEAAGKALAAMGHTVEPAQRRHGRRGNAARPWNDLFFFAFDSRLDGYARRAGTKPGPDTLEPVIWSLYQQAKEHHAGALHGRRGPQPTPRGASSARSTPSTTSGSRRPRRALSEPWGNYNLLQARRDGREQRRGAVPERRASSRCRTTSWARRPCRCRSPCTRPACRSACRSPAEPADEHLLLQLAAALEQAMPWRDRVPPLHVSKLKSGRLSGRERLLLHRRCRRFGRELAQRLEGRHDAGSAHLGALRQQAVEGMLGCIDLSCRTRLHGHQVRRVADLRQRNVHDPLPVGAGFELHGPAAQAYSCSAAPCAPGPAAAPARTPRNPRQRPSSPQTSAGISSRICPMSCTSNPKGETKPNFSSSIFVVR